MRIFEEGLTESKKRNLKESLFLGNEINPEKPFSPDWMKWVQKCQRWLDKEQLCGNHDEDFYDLLSAVGEELGGSYGSSARLKTPRQDYIKGLAEKGYEKARRFLQEFPEPDMYATDEVKEEEPVKMYALFTDGGNAYSAGRGADWYWASSDVDETEKDFKARVRYSAKRKAEGKYYEYDPRCLKCKFFKSLDAFKREAAKVGINPDLTESRKTNKKAIKEDVWDDIADIERGGFDEFRDDEYINPYVAKDIHDRAKAKGMSDLEFVNHEEWLDNLFNTDSDAADIEDNGRLDLLYVETPESLRQFYNEEIASGKSGRCLDYMEDSLNDMFWDATGYNVKEFFKIVKPYIGNPEAKNINALYKNACAEIKVWNDFVKELDREDLCFNVELNEMCSSGEFQRMAPSKVRRMVIQGNKKSLGKKDKYNRLGERNKK